MTEVKHVKARKDYPDFGIAKGEMYYVWVPGFRARTMRSKTQPRHRSQAYALQEQLEDFENPGDLGSMESFRDELVGDAESLRDEEQEKLDNMPDGLLEGDTGQKLQERIDALEAFIDELQSIDFDSEYDSETTEEEILEEEAQAKYEELTGVSLDVS